MSRLNEQNSIPVAPLVEAFKRSGLTPAEAALRCGWFLPPPRAKYGDGCRFRRRLGLAPETDRFGNYRPKTMPLVGLQVAAVICEALDIAPYEVGL